MAKQNLITKLVNVENFIVFKTRKSIDFLCFANPFTHGGYLRSL